MLTSVPKDIYYWTKMHKGDSHNRTANPINRPKPHNPSTRKNKNKINTENPDTHLELSCYQTIDQDIYKNNSKTIEK